MEGMAIYMYINNQGSDKSNYTLIIQHKLKSISILKSACTFASILRISLAPPFGEFEKL